MLVSRPFGQDTIEHVNDKASELIQEHRLEPHPEGGYYRRTYESDVSVPAGDLPYHYNGSRKLGSSIIFLLPATETSRLHRLKGDEMWHFYSGTQLTLHVFDSDDGYQKLLLDNDSEGNPQQLIGGGKWFGATVETGYVLAGCTVWPEFQFEDFELADKERMIEQFPEHGDLITRLTES